MEQCKVKYLCFSNIGCDSDSRDHVVVVDNVRDSAPVLII